MSAIVNLWNWIYEASGKNEWWMFVWGTWFIGFIPLCLYNVVFGLLDICGLPSFLRRYKVQPHRNVPMDTWKYLKTMSLALSNITIVTLISNTILYPLAKMRGIHFDGNSLPSFTEHVYYCMISLLLLEIYFYYGHRLLHQPSLFKYFHKQHHMWHAPCVMATFYCHPIEHFLVNIPPSYIGPLITGAHISFWWLFLNLCLINTTLAHSGYHFPFLPSPEAHDFHHSSGGTQNYGGIGLLDWLHGTDTNFRKSPAYKRHLFLFGLTPANKINFEK